MVACLPRTVLYIKNVSGILKIKRGNSYECSHYICRRNRTENEKHGKAKTILELYGKPIIIYTLEIFEKHPDIDMIIVPCVKGWEDYLQNLIYKFNITKVKRLSPAAVHHRNRN